MIINGSKVIKYIYETGDTQIAAPTLEVADRYLESWIAENTNYRGIEMYAKHHGYNLYYETQDGKKYTHNGTTLYEADEYGNLTKVTNSDAASHENTPTASPIIFTAETPADKLKELTDRLEQGVQDLFESDRFKEYLRVMAKFHNYSFNNCLLIAMQKPDATLVAGFTSWKNNFKRSVKKGEKGIKIFAPAPYKVKVEQNKIDEDTQQPIFDDDGNPAKETVEIKRAAFKVVTVFDVSQTDGEPLPDIAVDELSGSVERYNDFFAALEAVSPCPIEFENISGGAHGYYSLTDKRIAILEGMSEAQTLKTTIHEVAHAKLHDIDLSVPVAERESRPDRHTREVEAESVAYVVCQHYGLDTSDYSFGYIAGWSTGKELSELKSSLETIRNAAAEIIDGIDARLGKDKHLEAEQEAAKSTKQPSKPTKKKRSQSR